MTNRLPSTNVRIVRFHKIGSPEVLQLDELPLPIPGDAEVRLRVKAIGLNRAEVHFRQGRYRFPPVLPSKIGYEASGIVEAVGRDVNRSWLGKTVSTLPALPANKYAVYGEVAIVPVTAIKEYVFSGLIRGDFKPIIGRTFRLLDIVEAHRYMESNAQVGKIAVTV